MHWYHKPFDMFTNRIFLIVSCVKVVFLTDVGLACKQDDMNVPCNALPDTLIAIQSMIQYQNWKHVYLLLEDEHSDFLQSKLELDGIIMQFFKMENELKDLLNEVMDIQEKSLQFQRRFLNFIVVGTARKINGLMRKIQILSKEYNANILLRHFSKWLLFPPDDEDIVPNGFDNIAVIRCKTSCSDSNQPSNVESSANCASFTTQTMLWGSGGQALSQPMPFESLTNTSGSFLLYPNVKNGLNGQKLRLTITEWRPYAIKKMKDNITSFEGVCPDIINILSVLFNFTYDFTEPLDGQWGKLENGNWTGQIGDVYSGHADMTGSWLGMDYYRAKDVDFSYTLRISPYVIAYMRRNDEHPLAYLVRLYKVDVYLYGLLALGGMILFFLLVGVMLTNDHERNNRGFNQCTNSVMKLFFVVIAIALHQGISWTPGDISRRILLASFWLYTIIMTSVYCGNLIALRSVKKDVAPYDTLSEMIANEAITFGFEGESMLENILKLTDDEELGLLWQRIIKTKETYRSVMDTDRNKHVDRLHTGNYAFILEAMTVPLIMRGDCTVLLLDKTFLALPYSFAFPKHSPLPKLFNEKLILLLESGYIDRMSESWYPKSVCGPAEEQASQMVLKDYSSALIAVAGAILLAAGILLVECAIHRCKFYRMSIKNAYNLCLR